MIILEDNVITATIPEGKNRSNTIDMRKYSRMLVHMPDVWTAASIGFLVSDSLTGPFQVLCDTAAATVQIAGPSVNESYTAPDAVGKARFLKLWSQTQKASVNQASERNLQVDLKT